MTSSFAGSPTRYPRRRPNLGTAEPEQGRHRLAYVLPLRTAADDDPARLGSYLGWLAARVALVLVVDGSEPEVYARNAASFPASVRHVPPDPPGTLNGKVGGVCTGLRLAATEGFDACIVADDDVRYDGAALAAMAGALRDADVVRPQNYFDPLPWHAVEDTARTLINRAVGTDYPGTLGVRCAALPDGYAGDVLFENLELIRTARAFGGRVVFAPGLYVGRIPPTARHFWGQRIRQAYDSQAQPIRLTAELALLPALLAACRRPALLVAGAVAAAGAAETGRRRAGGRAYFPPVASACAPLWLAERALCSWLALGARLRGGVRYRSTRVAVAAHSPRELRRRAAASSRTGLMRPVAERLDRRPSAPAQGNGAPVAGHDRAVGVADLEIATHEQGPVGIGRHGSGGFRSHVPSLPKPPLSGTDAARVDTARRFDREET